MKRITTLTCAFALLTSQAHAIDVPEDPPAPEPPAASSGNDMAVAGAIVLLGVLIWGATRSKDDSSVMTSPRPLVRPEPSYDKLVEGE